MSFVRVSPVPDATVTLGVFSFPSYTRFAASTVTFSVSFLAVTVSVVVLVTSAKPFYRTIFSDRNDVRRRTGIGYFFSGSRVRIELGSDCCCLAIRNRVDTQRQSHCHWDCNGSDCITRCCGSIVVIARDRDSQLRADVTSRHRIGSVGCAGNFLSIRIPLIGKGSRIRLCLNFRSQRDANFSVAAGISTFNRNRANRRFGIDSEIQFACLRIIVSGVLGISSRKLPALRFSSSNFKLSNCRSTALSICEPFQLTRDLFRFRTTL